MSYSTRSEVWLAAYLAALAGMYDGEQLREIADKALEDFADRFPAIWKDLQE